MAVEESKLRPPQITRREFVRLAAIGAGATLLGSVLPEIFINKKNKLQFQNSLEEEKLKRDAERALDLEVKDRNGFILQMSTDSEWEQGKPLNETLTLSEAQSILKDHNRNIEENPKVISTLKEFNEKSVSAIDRAMKEILKPEDFLAKQYYDLQNDSVRTGLVLINDPKRLGGGHSFSSEFTPFSVIFNDYSNIDMESLRLNVAQQGAHENIIHRIQGKVSKQSYQEGGEVCHEMMGIAEDISRLAMGINIRPNRLPSEVIKIIMRGGMPREEAVRLAMRIGFGISDDILKAEEAYRTGRIETDPSSIAEHILGSELPGELITTEEVNQDRQIWARLSDITFVPIERKEFYSAWELIPKIRGWREDGCIEVNGKCLDMREGGVGLFNIVINRTIDNKEKFESFVSLVQKHSKSESIGYEEYLDFAKAFFKVWVDVGRPKSVNPEIWEKITSELFNIEKTK